MNERIRLLAEQAEIKFESHPQHQGVDTAVIIPSDLKKFAELIVGECAGIAYEYDAPKMSGPGMIIAGRIETHFGVEE